MPAVHAPVRAQPEDPFGDPAEGAPNARAGNRLAVTTRADPGRLGWYGPARPIQRILRKQNFLRCKEHGSCLVYCETTVLQPHGSIKRYLSKVLSMTDRFGFQ